MRSLLLLGFAALLSACSLAPDFVVPEVETPPHFKEAAKLPADERGAWKEANPAEHVARGEWWRVFADQQLDALEVEASAANAQLQAAAARLRQARELARFANAERWPQVDAGFGPTRQRNAATQPGMPDDVATDPYTVWNAGVQAAWEIDLFGRLGDRARAAESDAQSAEAIYQSLMLALQADVATLYFQLRGADAELALLRDTVGWREQNVDLTQKRFNAGVISELDLARAKTELATTRSEMHALERQRARLEHALAVLLGKAPASFDLPPAVAIGGALPQIPAGLPSTLLERRPDVSAAQYDLAAANARIGAARAAFFPVLNLTANGGFASNELSNLFSWSSRTWLLGPLLSVPIFSAGRSSANLDRAWAVYDESVANYRDRVLNAFAEVEDGLSDLRTLTAQAGTNADALVSARRASSITDLRYRAGAVSYFEVIDAQRSQLVIERSNVQIEAAQRTATVALIRALGGGWEKSSGEP
jgi:outer membrane protein, multidrug efflux system